MCGTKSFLEQRSAEYNKNNKQEYDDYICGKILANDEFIQIFKSFALASTSEGKIESVTNSWQEIINIFQNIKEKEGNKALCFGHFQKMFNMALKLYLCLYICKDALKLDKSYFDEEILSMLQYADCPVDSIILKQLDKKLDEKNVDGRKKHSNIKWSKIVETDDYKEIQEAIDKLNYKSRLSFDFKEWN